MNFDNVNNQKIIAMQNRKGDNLSLQPSVIGAITDLSTKNFKLPNNAAFLIKNEGTEEVALEVKLFGMEDSDEFVSTLFSVSPRWNPELVKEIKLNATAGITLKYGY